MNSVLAPFADGLEFQYPMPQSATHNLRKPGVALAENLRPLLARDAVQTEHTAECPRRT
jgi:hypothetical protein